MIPDIEHVAAKPREPISLNEATVWTRVGWWSSQSVRANPHATNNRKFQRVCNVIRAELIYDLSLHLSSMSVSTSRKYIPWYHAQTCLGATESWCLANSISGDIFIYIILFYFIYITSPNDMKKHDKRCTIVERCRKLLPRSTHYYPDVSPETYQTISTQVIKPGRWFSHDFLWPSWRRVTVWAIQASRATLFCRPRRCRRNSEIPTCPVGAARTTQILGRDDLMLTDTKGPSAMVKLQGQDSCVSPKFQILVLDTYLI